MTEIEHRLTAVEERSKSNVHRLDEMERRQDRFDELVSAVNVLAVREQQVETDVKEIKTEVKTISTKLVETQNASDKKDAEKWDKAVNTIITVFLSAIAGFILAKLGF